MELSIILSFLAASILLTVAPGPDNLFVIAQSMSYGFRAGFITSLGLCTGLIGHTLIASLGLSAILYQSTVIFTAIKSVGAIYLLYLAWESYKQGKSAVSGKIANVKSLSLFSLYKRGILMNLLNPKVSLFFLAFLPQFVSTNSGHVQLDMFVLGLIFIVQALVLFSLFSALAGKIKILFQSKKTVSAIHYGKSILFAVLGGKLLFTKI
ncbi:LysE family translocator [Bacillaceae bacterium ZC4]|nr:LysE family translocator [Bacillaceae bacterium ZC4]